MKRNLIVFGTIAVILLGLLGLGIYSSSGPNDPKPKNQGNAPNPNSGVSQNAATFVRFHSPSFGNQSAPVIVVEWLDPECEGCRAMYQPFEKIISAYSDRVRFVLRYMPFHSNSLYAASALEEAREHGKFKEALEILFEKQPEWANHGQPRPELIPLYLEKLGIPKQKLEREYLIEKHGAKIKQDEDDGLKAGVTGTPSFFVNGIQVSDLSEESIRFAIDSALRQAK